ncbi:hypothetical protein CK203_091133 [Vitis vinifera]|uniref:Uncharacterized protein n=1 Tax=Vitis vinifera TaxID=29760 RepID=A0A438EYA7_VITVI|nr:hypothetical protein CK203_091133 [Vitis vinifera]
MAAASISKTLSKGARGLKNHWIPTPLFPHLYSSSAPVSASASASVLLLRPSPLLLNLNLQEGNRDGVGQNGCFSFLGLSPLALEVGRS